MVATDIGTLLDDSGFDRISILKVDIEGAESVVFGSTVANYSFAVGSDTRVVEANLNFKFGTGTV